MNSSNRLIPLLIEAVLILLTLCFLFYFLLGFVLEAQFTLTDDHVILAFSSGENLNLISFWHIIVNNITDGDRFRPGYWLFYLSEVALFGPNPQIWHLAFIGYGVLTGFFFYIAARRAGSDIISSFLFILSIIIGPQISIWYRLGTGETWGMLLTAIAIFAIVQAAQRNRPNIWDGMAIFLMFLAGTPKESFILPVPALLLLRLTLHSWLHKESWKQTTRKLLPFLIAGIVVFVVEMILVSLVLMNTPTGYGAKAAGLSVLSFDPMRWYQLLAASNLAIFASYTLIFYLLLFVICWPRRKFDYPYLFSTILIILAWIIPQFILYSGGGFSFGHYLFPAVVGFAVASTLGLSVLWYKRLWVLWAVAVLGVMWPILTGIGPATHDSSSFTAQTLALSKMKNYLTDNVTDQQSIILIADPANQYEWTFSIPQHLKYANLNAPIYLLPVYPEDGVYDQDLATTAINDLYAGYTNVEMLQADNVGAIIAFKAPNATTKGPSWFKPTDWRTMIFDSPYCSFSFKEFRCVKVADYEYTILVPNSTIRN